MSRRTIPARSIIGRKVMNVEGETLGRIADLVLDAETGQAAYAVLAFGGMWGHGQKLFAVPWASLKPNTLDNVVYLDVDRATLERARGFDKRRWPDAAIKIIVPTESTSTEAPTGAEPTRHAADVAPTP